MTQTFLISGLQCSFQVYTDTKPSLEYWYRFYCSSIAN